MTVPEARCHPRLRRYPLRRLRLPTAAGTLSLVVPDSAAWLRTAAGAARAGAVRLELGDEPPYWADVWPAAVVIARWLCRRRDLAEVRVLDLGCGVGVPGAAAAMVGARVTFADREPDALAFAEFNGRPRGSAADSQAVTTALLDWRGETLEGCFDVICLADVTYRPVHHRPILRQLEACLAGDGLVLHADPFRRESNGFLAQIRREYACRQVELSTHWRSRRLPVRLALVAREQAALERWLDAASASDCVTRPVDPLVDHAVINRAAAADPDVESR